MRIFNCSGVRLLLITLLFLILPCGVLISGWHWFAEPKPYWLVLYYVTETASMPYGILTSGVLAFVVLCYCHLPFKKALLLFVMMIGVILAGQLIKTAIKSWQQEPRPYVVWLEKQGHVASTQMFYQQPRDQRVQFLKQQTLSTKVPVWLEQHWQAETGYSFPSGHTIFAASWALMIFSLLLRKKAYVFIGTMILWAITMELSRLLLGMHWPRDLILSCFFAWLLVWIAGFFWNRWVFEEIL